jgi:hypothetical protein
MRKDVQRMPKSRDQSDRKHTQHNMIEHAKSSVCVWQRKQNARARTWYILVRMACCQVRDRQRRARPDARRCPFERFTLEAKKQREICRFFFSLTLASEHAYINN